MRVFLNKKLKNVLLITTAQEVNSEKERRRPEDENGYRQYASGLSFV